MVKINFSYTDEFGNESNLIKSYTDPDVAYFDNTQFGFLLDEFKTFMFSIGFPYQLVERIEIKED